METIQDYFARPDTPASGSPVGVLMVRVLEKNPGMTFEEARNESNALLDRAAGRKFYEIPRVLSQEERTRETERLRKLRTLPLAA
jgi:hypothetical protein